METIKRLLEGNDLCAVLLLALLFAAVGVRLVRGRTRLHGAGVACGFVGAIAYGAYGWLEFQPAVEVDLVGLAVRSLLAGFTVTAAAWVVLGMAGFVHEHTLRPVSRWVKEWKHRVEEGRRKRREFREREERRRHEEAEYARQAPARKQAQLEAEACARATAAAQRRREDARVSCELLYSVCVPEIKDRFPRADFEDFLNRYLADQHALFPLCRFL